MQAQVQAPLLQQQLMTQQHTPGPTRLRAYTQVMRIFMQGSYDLVRPICYHHSCRAMHIGTSLAQAASLRSQCCICILLLLHPCFTSDVRLTTSPPKSGRRQRKRR